MQTAHFMHGFTCKCRTANLCSEVGFKQIVDTRMQVEEKNTVNHIWVGVDV